MIGEVGTEREESRKLRGEKRGDGHGTNWRKGVEGSAGPKTKKDFY